MRCLSPDWEELVAEAVERWSTPIYVLDIRHVRHAIAELEKVYTPVPIRILLSAKTLSSAFLFQEWLRNGRCVEVVSEYEVRAALHEGFKPRQIVVNGTAKHRWLSTLNVNDLFVQFDSLREIHEMAAEARVRDWHVGIRLHTQNNRDPDDPKTPDQFGIHPGDVGQAVNALSDNGHEVNCVSFHLYSNQRSIRAYLDAVSEASVVCKTHGIQPRILDIGGGIPSPGEEVDGIDGKDFPLNRVSVVCALAQELFDGLLEIWIEPGRFVTSQAGVLAIRVWDIKEYEGLRILICDGGRVTHAFPSDWQTHRISVIPERSGEMIDTIICGPTCMAYDQMTRRRMPRSITTGDTIIWHNAGAYHLSWESMFSHGLSPIAWYDGYQLHLTRVRQRFEDWWEIR